jgi:hypothetical protein
VEQDAAGLSLGEEGRLAGHKRQNQV